jgi:ABC-type polysaccharide/polyol phosphate export permease
MFSTVGVAAGPPNLPERLRRLWTRRETIRYLVASNLKAGHRNKVLGNLWNLLDPLLSLFVYFLVFGIWLGQGRDDVKDYLVYLFIGILAWRFLDGSVTQAVNCIRGNRGLIGEIHFPKAVFPLSICLSRLYDFLWGLFVLLVVMLATGFPLSWHLLWLPPLIAVQLLLLIGAAYLVAYLGAFFADTANILMVVIRLGFYASPILYYVDGDRARIGAQWLPYYMLNPLACLLEGYRSGLMRQHSPDPVHTAYLVGFALVLLIFGYGLFARGEGKFAKYV